LVLEETIYQRFTRAKPELVDVTLVDFDGVTYHISTPTSKNQLVVSMRIKCFNELAKYGALDVLRCEYGAYLMATPEQDYDVSLQFNLDSLNEDKDQLARKVALIRRNVLAAPFEQAFRDYEQGTINPKVVRVQYRDEEAIYIQAQPDRVTVIFSTLFKEEVDRIIGRVFLQEFVDARRHSSLANAPQVLYSHREPPLEIRDLVPTKEDDSMGFVTFVVFPRHFEDKEVRADTISKIQLFRDFFHYHIKCSKAYLHSRMRTRVQDFLKVINRAKPERMVSEKKLASGRTFRPTPGRSLASLLPTEQNA